MKTRFFRTVFVAGLLVAGAFSPGRTQDFAREDYLPPPPHDRLECICHYQSSGPGSTTPQTMDDYRQTFVTGDNTTPCQGCHKNRCMHLSDVDLPAAVKPTLPLGRTGASQGKVVCYTCHDIHRGRLPALLRTPGTMSETKNWGACDNCHRREVYAIHGKAQAPYTPLCASCHPQAPTPGAKDSVLLTANYFKVCLFCHPDPPVSCLNAVRPEMAGIIARQIKSLQLPLREGRMTCGSCHRVMDDLDDRRLIRPEYARFRDKIAVKNIHRTGMLCTPCHGSEIRRSNLNPPLVEKDPEKRCRVCHDNKLARADVHPSGIVPRLNEKVTIPNTFPLADGKLVCTTCHSICMWWKTKEPDFIRGGPFANREDACFQCHSKEGYRQFVPHVQLDAQGAILEQVCLYCHSSVPGPEIQGIDAVGFVSNLKFYCIGCHTDTPPHPAGFQHAGRHPRGGMIKRIAEFEKERQVVFPRSPEGEVLCFTCHNPHQPGVLKGGAGVESFFSRLRQGEGYVVCNACHGGGGLR